MAPNYLCRCARLVVHSRSRSVLLIRRNTILSALLGIIAFALSNDFMIWGFQVPIEVTIGSLEDGVIGFVHCSYLLSECSKMAGIGHFRIDLKDHAPYKASTT